MRREFGWRRAAQAAPERRQLRLHQSRLSTLELACMTVHRLVECDQAAALALACAQGCGMQDGRGPRTRYGGARRCIPHPPTWSQCGPVASFHSVFIASSTLSPPLRAPASPAPNSPTALRLTMKLLLVAALLALM